MKPKISIFGPSHRTHLWKPFFESIITNLDFEVIFVSDIEPKPEEIPMVASRPGVLGCGVIQDPRFKYIISPVKPAQGFEIGYRESKGEMVCWTGDDFVYSPYAFDHAYNMYRSFHNHKIIISFNVYQDGLSASHEHQLPWMKDKEGPQLTTTGIISKQAIEEVGGLADINFVCGHWDVDLMLRIFQNGGKLFICHGAYAYEPHNQFHQNSEKNFSYDWQDELNYLTELWKGRTGRRYPFQPYSNENILTKSQGNIGKSGKWQ